MLVLLDFALEISDHSDVSSVESHEVLVHSFKDEAGSLIEKLFDESDFTLQFIFNDFDICEPSL